MENKVLERIWKVICRRIQIDYYENPNQETDLIEKLGFDSVLFIELIVDLEKEFSISFDDELLEIKNFRTLKQITELVNQIMLEKKI